MFREQFSERAQAMFRALEANDVNTLRRFLSAGADPDARNSFGLTLLQIALRDEKYEAAALLLEMGADTEARVATTGHTAIFYAIGGNSDRKLVDLMIRANADIEAVDQFGYRPLHMAAAKGSPGAVAELIAAGADVSAQENEGRTPRDLALKEYGILRQPRHAQCERKLRAAEEEREIAMLNENGRRAIAEEEAINIRHRKQAEHDIALLKSLNPRQLRHHF